MIQKIIDTTFSQKVLGKLHQYILRGMNYANSGNYEESGEFVVLKWIEKINDGKKGVIFDVGGNHGGYTKAVRSIFSDEVTIHAFEPSVKTFAIFKEHTQQITGVVANNIGLGENEATLTLFSNTEGSGLASVYDRKIEHYGIVMDQKEEVKISTVDLYCKQMNINNILLLKLDIEGHEFSALKGAAGMLKAKAIQCIQFECGGTNIDSRTYFKDFYDLLSPQYRIYRILKTGLFEIKRYSETNEVFLSVNYLAVLK